MKPKAGRRVDYFLARLKDKRYMYVHTCTLAHIVNLFFVTHENVSVPSLTLLFVWSYRASPSGRANIQFATCSCVLLVLTMVRARLWPSASQRPHFAFAFELLDWAESLLLEAQVSSLSCR